MHLSLALSKRLVSAAVCLASSLTTLSTFSIRVLDFLRNTGSSNMLVASLGVFMSRVKFIQRYWRMALNAIAAKKLLCYRYLTKYMNKVVEYNVHSATAEDKGPSRKGRRTSAKRAKKPSKVQLSLVKIARSDREYFDWQLMCIGNTDVARYFQIRLVFKARCMM